MQSLTTKQFRSLLALVMSICVGILTSCDSDLYAGYSEQVVFEREGGSMDLVGNATFTELSIRTLNNSVYVDVNPSTTLPTSLQWLSLTWPVSNEVSLDGQPKYRMKVTAQPNTTGQERKLYIDGGLSNIHITIVVTQKP